MLAQTPLHDPLAAVGMHDRGTDAGAQREQDNLSGELSVPEEFASRRIVWA